MGKEGTTGLMKGGKRLVKGKVRDKKRKEKVIDHLSGMEWVAIPLVWCYQQTSYFFSVNKTLGVYIC